MFIYTHTHAKFGGFKMHFEMPHFKFPLFGSSRLPGSGQTHTNTHAHAHTDRKRSEAERVPCVDHLVDIPSMPHPTLVHDSENMPDFKSFEDQRQNDGAAEIQDTHKRTDTFSWDPCWHLPHMPPMPHMHMPNWQKNHGVAEMQDKRTHTDTWSRDSHWHLPHMPMAHTAHMPHLPHMHLPNWPNISGAHMYTHTKNTRLHEHTYSSK